jgi:hypothetical protein
MHFMTANSKLASYSTVLSHVYNGASYLWQMVCTRSAEEWVLDIPRPSAGRGQAPCGNAPPPPPPCLLVSLEQLLAMQNKLMRMHAS